MNVETANLNRWFDTEDRNSKILAHNTLLLLFRYGLVECKYIITKANELPLMDALGFLRVSLRSVILPEGAFHLSEENILSKISRPSTFSVPF